MIEELLEFLKWCNIRRKQFISILHQFKKSRSFSIIHCTVFALLLLVPSFGEGQYLSHNREKQFPTRRVLSWLAVGCGWPESFSYYNASDAHHVKFTFQNDHPNSWNLSQKSLAGRGVRHIGGTVQSLYFLSWTTVIFTVTEGFQTGRICIWCKTHRVQINFGHDMKPHIFNRLNNHPICGSPIIEYRVHRKAASLVRFDCWIWWLIHTAIPWAVCYMCCSLFHHWDYVLHI